MTHVLQQVRRLTVVAPAFATFFLAACFGHAGAETPPFVPAGSLYAQAPVAQPPQPTPNERVAMVKQWLQASGKQLRSYEWIETTVVSLGGADALCSARSGALVYFGADSQSRKAGFHCQAGRVSFELPGETLFALSWSAP